MKCGVCHAKITGIVMQECEWLNLQEKILRFVGEWKIDRALVMKNWYENWLTMQIHNANL